MVSLFVRGIFFQSMFYPKMVSLVVRGIFFQSTFYPQDGFSLCKRDLVPVDVLPQDGFSLCKCDLVPVYVENTTSSMHSLTCLIWSMTSCTSTLINNSQLSGDVTKIFCNVNKVNCQFIEWILKSSKDRTASLMDHMWLQINYKILHRTRSRYRTREAMVIWTEQIDLNW